MAEEAKLYWFQIEVMADSFFMKYHRHPMVVVIPDEIMRILRADPHWFTRIKLGEHPLLMGMRVVRGYPLGVF